MIYSKLGSSARTKDFEEDFSTPKYELYEDDDGDQIAHAQECDDEPTSTTYDTNKGAEVFLPKEMTWFLELSCKESRILRDSPLVRLIRIQSWTQGFTMLNSQMVRMQNWEQISLQNACMLNVTLKVTYQIVDHRKNNTTWFAKITNMLL